MEPEDFALTDAELEALLDGHGAGTDSDLQRFILDLRSEVESFEEEPSPKLASWIANFSCCHGSNAAIRAHVAELDNITESLAQLR